MSKAVKRPTAHDLLAHPANFFALGFGSGLAKYAPGTFGSLAALPIFLCMPRVNIYFYIGIVIVLFAFGVWVCEASARQLGLHDHPAIVWDEIVGMLITLFLVPFSILPILLGFLLFRFFDIIKPWPIGWIDRRVDGGMGIMLDDVLAGLMAWAVLQLTVLYLVPWVIQLTQ